MKNTAHNRWGFWLGMATVGFSCLWALYFLAFKNSIELGEYKAREESAQASELSQEEINKPWLSTQNLIAQGAKVYKAQCALCHGAKGLGDGTPGLVPPPRNLVEGKWTKGGSSKALFITLQKGIEGTSMLSFKHLPVQDRWALVHYVRSLTKNKTPDDKKELEDFAVQAL